MSDATLAITNVMPSATATEARVGRMESITA